jgi:hypothetical protein
MGNNLYKREVERYFVFRQRISCVPAILEELEERYAFPIPNSPRIGGRGVIFQGNCIWKDYALKG